MRSVNKINEHWVKGFSQQPTNSYYDSGTKEIRLRGFETGGATQT